MCRDRRRQENVTTTMMVEVDVEDEFSVPAAAFPQCWATLPASITERLEAGELHLRWWGTNLWLLTDYSGLTLNERQQ